MIRLILAFGAIVALSAPAMAGEYYIAHGNDRHCRVVESIPDGHVRIGPLSFHSRDEAERQVRVVCRDNGYYRGEGEREERRENR